MEVFRQVASAAPPDLRAHAPGVPPELASLIRGGLAKDPAQRPSLSRLARTSAALLDPAEGGLLRRAWRALGGS